MTTSAKRILMVTGSLKIGGAEVMAVSAVRHLVQHGLEFDFLVFGDETGELKTAVEELGCRILRMPGSRQLGARRYFTALVSLMRAEGPYDAVHSHVNHASGLILAAAARAGIPVRVAHSHAAHESANGIHRHLYQAASKVLIRKYANRWSACGDEAGVQLFGRDWRTRGSVVPNGVNVDKFLSARSSRDEMRQTLGIPQTAILTGSVARLVTVKNHEFIIRFVKLAVDHGQDVHCLFVGDGPLRFALIERAALAGVKDRIHFLGMRRDVPQLLAAMDAVLMPSFHEGLPVSLVEAQASGTPILASSGVTREVDLGIGLVTFLPLDEPETWLETLTSLASTQPVPDLAVKTAFRERGYDVSSSAELLAALYEGDS